MHSASTVITVPFHDVDSMGVAWHGHYLKYFEVARCELLQKYNYSYQQMAESGYSWPVIDVRIRYAKPLYFEQKIKVTATITEWVNRLKITYTIHDCETGKRLTKGYTVQVAVNKVGEMQYESPQVVFDRLGLPLD